MAKKLLIFIGLSVCFCGVLIAVYAMSSNTVEDAGEDVSANVKEPPFKLPEISLGNPQAPHTVIMYFALDCAHCREYEDKILPEIKKQFIDTGEMRFILYDCSGNPLGFLASKVSWAKRDPQQYLVMLKKLFARQEYWNVTDGYKKRLLEVSGLTEQEFNDCINDQDLDDAIMWKRFQAKEIAAVPTFVIDGEQIDEIMKPDVFISFRDKKQKSGG